MRTGAQDAQLLGWVLVGVFDIDERRIGNVQDAKVAAHAHVLFDAEPQRGHNTAIGDGGIGDLLNAMQMARKTGGDDATASLLGEQAAQHSANRGLARCVAMLF